MSEPEYWIARCNGADAATLWPQAVTLLDPAIRLPGSMYEPDDVRALVTGPYAGSLNGWSLWLAGERMHVVAAWVTDIRTFPRGRIVETVFGGGAGTNEPWFESALAEMDKYAKEAGAKRLRCMGRRGWSSLGYRTIGYVHERNVA